MNKLYSKALKVLKRIYAITNYEENSTSGRNWKIFPQKEYANSLIFNALMSDKPIMIARFGANELACLINYLGVKQNKKNYISYIKGNCLAWWWNNNIIKQMNTGAGFFPARVDKIEQFCELMIKDIPEVDIIGSWLKEETFFANELGNAKKVMLEDLEPFFAENPWTKGLKGKKVLIVHPFAETIRRQYEKRELIFDNNFLPEFELKTIKAVQSIAGTKTEFKDWFEALDYMKGEIEKTDFDICILGCGAYGFPLAAHIKRMGKKAIHLAGATQLLFGIKGKRWEEYIVYPYTNLYNEYWIRPGENEKPELANVVENGCYW